MYTHKLDRQPKNTVIITVDIPRSDIGQEYKKSFAALQSELTVEGFRKGKAPLSLAEKHIKKESVYSHLIQTLVPRIYEEIVKKESLKPIVQPKLELVRAKENEDWQVKITVAEKPVIDLTGYKEVIKKVKSAKKAGEIWTPGKEPTKKESDEKEKHALLNTILDALLKALTIEIPPLIIETELNNRLSQLVDDIQKVGLTTESYLKSKNLTMDELKKRLTREIEDTYKLEFLLADIADKEGLKVEKEDLDKLFASIKTEAERKQAEANAYFYASILRKQKAIDYLTSL